MDKHKESEFNILKQVHTKLVNDHVDYRLKSLIVHNKLVDKMKQMEVDHYNEMVRLRKELSDLKLRYNQLIIRYNILLEEGD